MIKAKFNGSVGSKTPTVDCQRKWDTRGGRKPREFGGGVSSLDEVEHFRERSRDVQTETSKAVAAEERTEAARFFVRRVRTVTRRKTHPLETIRIVLEGFRREVAVNESCRREGIKPHSYYAWTKEFMEAGKERLTRDSVRDATREEVHQLKRENGELKQLVADLSLEVYRLKKTSIPMPQGAGGISG